MPFVGSLGLKKRDMVLVCLAAGLSFTIITISLSAMSYLQLFPSSIIATKDNPLGIEARVAYVHQNSAYSCPISPCDSSGFVLKVVSKNEDAVLHGYDVCKAGGGWSWFASCVHSDTIMQSLSVTSELSNDSHEWSNAIPLERKSDWHVGDTVDIKVKVTATNIETINGWIELGESPILEFQGI